MDINRFPTEILSLILAHLHTPELPWPSDVRHVANARLVCRKWNALAAPLLFRSLQIGHNSSSLQAWDTVIDVPEVRSATQRVTILAAPESVMQRQEGQWKSASEKAAYHGLLDCVGGIAELPNLRELDVRFHQWCGGIRSPLVRTIRGRHDFELPFTDENILLAAFNALRQRATRMPGATPVRSLALTNPQNMPLPALVESELFADVATHIDSLHLLVTEEGLGAMNYVFAPLPERQGYELYIQQKLLPPLSDQLATLTLAFYEHWGLLPAYFNPLHLSFPRLRTLTIAEFVIGHDDHLDWVLAQTSLTTLRLHRCYVASHLRLRQSYVQSWHLRTGGWEQKPLGSYGFMNDDHPVFTNPGTWAAVLQRISTRLPNLAVFRLENDKPHFWFRAHGIEGARLSRRRYIVCDIGNCRGPWIETDENGEMDFGNNDPDPLMLDYAGRPWDVKMGLNRAAETEQADGEALEALLETIRGR